MRRSSIVLAPLLASAAAALLTGCHTDTQTCVDENNRAVDPKFCQNLQPGQTHAGTVYDSGSGGYYSNGIFYPHIFRYYYGGHYGGLGSFMSGGSYAPSAGHSYSIGGTTRGGFGSSFSGEGHGSGGHGGGGE
ncbi:MAG: hypothetical protein V4555_07480 [Acidobacteriota bacterium]